MGILFTVAASLIGIICYFRSKIKENVAVSLLNEGRVVKAPKILAFTPEVVEADL